MPALLMAVIVVALTADVVGRYVFSHPLQSASEVSLIAFIWLIYLAVTAVSRKGQHIAIDVLTQLFSQRWQAIVEVFVQVIAMLVMVYLIVNGLDYFLNGNFVPLTGTGLSKKYLELAIPVSAAFMIVYAARDLVRAVIGAITGRFERPQVVDEEIERIDDSYRPDVLRTGNFNASGLDNTDHLK
ncbi:TRAP transporter small permease [Ruicaihuangia caeni]|uniref:TRAP transporter small permease n=1 Tax=Ruicaihuangia caeni TaxID=3042517 RepID=UPI00338E9175